jgi:tetratricopeptide (TPR) repeat protein
VLIELRNDINDYKRYFILGSLWEKCLSREKALKFFENAEKLSNGKNKAKAKFSLARVYHRHYGKSEANSAMKNYLESFQIFMDEGCILEAAQCKLGLANFNRKQLKKINEAHRICEEIKLMLGRINEKNSKYKFVLAQYLNTLGLIYMDLRIVEFTDQCINLFEDSIKYRLEIKDVEGEAETENYLGLFIRNNNSKAFEAVNDSIKHLEKALEIRKSIGDHIGVAQTCRNLGLSYTDLIKIIQNEKDKRKYFQLAKEIFEEGLNYWHIMKGDPPLEEKLELQYRLGELLIIHGDVNEGILILEKVEIEHNELGDWHNRARILILLCGHSSIFQ